jgi:tetratricopeptide (TPR) repeat protein
MRCGRLAACGGLLTRRLRPAILLSLTVAVFGQTPDTCRQLYRRGKLSEAHACYKGLAESRDPLSRAEGLWHVRDYQGANAAFRAAVAARPGDADAKTRWGLMYVEHYQPGDAVALFEEALKARPDYAPALLGMALAASQDYESRAVEFAQAALKADPKFVEARALLARLALEDSDTKGAAEEAAKALETDPNSLETLSVRATIDWLDDKGDTEWIARITKIDPVYGEAYTTAASLFVLNRRYEEGIRFYHKALELNPDLLDARAELGIQLMRMGDEREARKLLESCYNEAYRVPPVVNSLRLLDSYKNFQTFRTSTTILRLNKKEADLLRPYFQEQLDRALAVYEDKYKLKLTRPVQVEVYPDHEDFAVRTMGMPGLGALGVTFGSVIAMDSPSGRKPGDFHWASTLWHELSHVYVLAATNSRVPRWFTEGMAVHEETAVSPEWGDRLTPEVLKAIHDKKLLPVSTLDRGFVRPSYPSQVIVSYFQAGRICDYINERWGYDKLLAMMHSFAARKTTPEVVQQQLGESPEQFDKDFLAWLNGKTSKEVAGFEDWRKRLRLIAEAEHGKNWDKMIAEGTAIRDIYPDYVEAGSVYEFLSEAYNAKGDRAKAVSELERYTHAGGRNPATLKQLAAWEAEAGRKRDAAQVLARLNLIAPNDEDLHRKLGALLLETGDNKGAAWEWQAVVAMKPVDTAGANFELAKALQAAGKKDDARDAVLNALEAAPGYKPAQRLLLELDGKD